MHFSLSYSSTLWAVNKGNPSRDRTGNSRHPKYSTKRITVWCIASNGMMCSKACFSANMTTFSWVAMRRRKKRMLKKERKTRNRSGIRDINRYRCIPIICIYPWQTHKRQRASIATGLLLSNIIRKRLVLHFLLPWVRLRAGSLWGVASGMLQRCLPFHVRPPHRFSVESLPASCRYVPRNVAGRLGFRRSPGPDRDPRLWDQTPASPHSTSEAERWRFEQSESR